MNPISVYFLQSPWTREACFLFDKSDLLTFTKEKLLLLDIDPPSYVIEYILFDDAFQGVDIAEQVFDMMNNPNRQTERDRNFPLCRSLSVGDIVRVNNTMYLCCSMGWETIEL